MLRNIESKNLRITGFVVMFGNSALRGIKITNSLAKLLKLYCRRWFSPYSSFDAKTRSEAYQIHLHFPIHNVFEKRIDPDDTSFTYVDYRILPSQPERLVFHSGEEIRRVRVRKVDFVTYAANEITSRHFHRYRRNICVYTHVLCFPRPIHETES